MPHRARGTRAALLDAALDAFARRGFAGASIREITRAVGVRESAFYAHFTGKRAAYDELFAEAGPPAAALALDAFPADVAPDEFFPRFARAVIDAWSTPRSRKFAAMTMRDAFDSKGLGWQALSVSISGFIQLLAERYKAWQANGRVRSDVPAETLAYQFITPIALARFLFFNIVAGKAEAARGHQLIDAHVTATIALVKPRAQEGR